MFELLFGLAGLGGLLAHWRLSLGLVVTIAVCLGIIFGVPNEVAQWLLGVPVLLIGATVSYLWQSSSEAKNEDDP